MNALSPSPYSAFPPGATVGQTITISGITYVYDGTKWVVTSGVGGGGGGGVPPSTMLPLMDGIAAIGSIPQYTPADHVHPSDTSLVPLAGNVAMTGPLTLSADPTTALGAWDQAVY
jgi:hypothetical protein